jgi:RHH-type proline utilization regulon transcriptional repressor/proline dehydrogenase/delta 1-pyrroline-5-carboxylate dehydrogenase
VGAALAGHALCAGVAFTGSDATARAIQRTLAAGDRPIVPLIAETGGINAMIVDSTGLPEQIVDGIVASAFLSAGQRCSALRLLCVHADLADEVLAMLAGAMQELRVGDAREAATDIGPLIDEEAFGRAQRQVQVLRRHGRLVAETPLPDDAPPHCLAPLAFEIDDIALAKEEIFAPVLQIVRWGAGTRLSDLDALVDAINALGYGLTLGIQTRIEQRAQAVAARARVGNVYVNRAMTGAVVGVHPFGGMQRSGTGPKAGGPHYLKAFCTEQTISVNTASIGGNLELLQ